MALLFTCIGACSASPAPNTAAEEPAVTRTDPEIMERRREQLRRKAPDRIPAPAPATTGEVPADVMDNVLAALEKLTGSERAAFKVLRAEEKLWPDGSLGCPQPGMVYSQATVPGYHVVVDHAGREYDYRVGGNRYLVLCLAAVERVPSGAEVPTS